nr:MAG TPA: hypothetical protein [Caudoviricetes sp.]
MKFYKLSINSSPIKRLLILNNYFPTGLPYLSV